MYAGTGKVDITPSKNVWMDGMIRSHESEGVHDPIFARALVISNRPEPAGAFAVVSVDVCTLSGDDVGPIREEASARTGIPAQNIILAATHNHSGPATHGFFNPKETEYVTELGGKLVKAIEQAAGSLLPVLAGFASGKEGTISHYRRLLADDGHIVMNWEPWPEEHLLGPVGAPDTELGVLKLVSADDPSETVCLLFNFTCHPNVLSGDNYLISAEYPGLAERLLEEKFGGTAIFLNGAQGSSDIDGLRDRDWEGLDRIGRALAEATAETAGGIVPSSGLSVRGSSVVYPVSARRISDEELAWAEKILEQTGGKVQALADGVGDDYVACLFKEIRQMQGMDVPVEQVCFAVGDTAFISFPGELFTEIGMRVKAESPFRHTYIIGLANDYVGYVPTRVAIHQGGYEPSTRRLDDSAEEIIARESVGLLRKVFGL